MDIEFRIFNKLVKVGQQGKPLTLVPTTDNEMTTLRKFERDALQSNKPN